MHGLINNCEIITTSYFDAQLSEDVLLKDDGGVALGTFAFYFIVYTCY